MKKYLCKVTILGHNYRIKTHANSQREAIEKVKADILKNVTFEEVTEVVETKLGTMDAKGWKKFVEDFLI